MIQGGLNKRPDKKMLSMDKPTAPKSSACRCLFGEPDHEENLRDLENFNRSWDEQSNIRWNFNFKSGKPLFGQFQWKKVKENDTTISQGYEMPMITKAISPKLFAQMNSSAARTDSRSTNTTLSKPLGELSDNTSRPCSPAVLGSSSTVTISSSSNASPSSSPSSHSESSRSSSPVIGSTNSTTTTTTSSRADRAAEQEELSQAVPSTRPLPTPTMLIPSPLMSISQAPASLSSNPSSRKRKLQSTINEFFTQKKMRTTMSVKRRLDL